MTRTRAGAGGVPGPMNAAYYRQRASAGVIVTECTAVSPDSAGILRAPGIHEARQVEGWAHVVDAVHAAGGRIVCQLWHCGRVSHPDLQPGGGLPVAPSAVAAQGGIFTPSGRKPYPVPRALAVDEIPGVVERFRRGAENALAAGFDGVELHGAFGYLPDQFLQDEANRRDDAYGGPVPNRCRFMLEVAAALVGVWGAGRVGVKLSPANRHYGICDGNAPATFGHLVRELDAFGLAYLHLMEPDAGDLAADPGVIRDVAATFRPLLRRTALVANGGYDQNKAEAALRAGVADAVSFGRLFIANPDLPERFRRGAALNPPDASTYYGEGPHGYTDHPALGTARP